jgi:hypothetical protein
MPATKSTLVTTFFLFYINCGDIYITVLLALWSAHIHIHCSP